MRDEFVKPLHNTAAQYRWVIANLVLAFVCVALGATALFLGYLEAGLPVLVLSGALVLNSDFHRKRGDETRGR